MRLRKDVREPVDRAAEQTRIDTKWNFLPALRGVLKFSLFVAKICTSKPGRIFAEAAPSL